MKSLFEAGVHLGHKTERWHPKMKPYIYGSKAGIYILDLRQTMERLKEAYDYIYNLSANGGRVLFVGTKFQARDVIAEEANRTGNHYANLRWLGGMLTNFQTIKQSLTKLRKYEEQAGPEGNYPGILKKEAVRLERDRKKLDSVLGGIRDMRKIPAAMFVVDIKREEIAIQEAKRLGIPVVAVVDSNCDPRLADIAIPGNDDSVHCIELFVKVIAQASQDGRKAYEASSAAETKDAKPAKKGAAPKAAAPKAAAPKAAAPKAAAPKADAPKAEAPKADAPKKEEAKPEVKAEEPKAAALEVKAEEPKADSE